MERPAAPPAFPFQATLSFAPLLDHWRAEARHAVPARAAVAAALLDHAAAVPLFGGPIDDPALVEAHRPLVETLLGAAVGGGPWEEVRAAVAAPFAMTHVIETPVFRRLAGGGDPEALYARLRNLDTASFTFGRTLKAYSFILAECYGVDLPFVYPLLLATPDPQTGLERHYRLHYDTRFCRVQVHGALPELTDADVERLVAEPADLALWQALLPPEHFVFEGFVVVSALDVTDGEVLSALKTDLLDKGALTSADGLAHLEGRFRALYGRADLELGLLRFGADEQPALARAQPVGRSLALAHGEDPPDGPAEDSVYATALCSVCDPVVVPDLRRWPTRTAWEERLLARGVRSLLVAPLVVDGVHVGLLELGAPVAGALHLFGALRLFEVVDLFATSLRRALDEREDRVQALIKAKYTAIHPTVEWRFRQSVLRFMARQERGEPATLEPIVFPDVYPLYGLSDIRDSSVLRNEAVQADLVEQLSLALAVVVEASVERPLPILDELGHRIATCAEAVQNGLSSEDESSVLDFLRHEVEPLFDPLARFGGATADRIAAYRDALDPDLGLLYQRRCAFEQSLTLVNDTISAHLDEQERYAQAMFPHYFEKYKTDGVDHNVYIGGSLRQDGHFDLLYLHNLRLWQLMTMCSTAWAVDALRPRLPVPLEVTHLVLVHSTPLAIRFRQDEKQFDVDGAYNIRYEIAKKRIDKAQVHPSGERLTQPGHVAVVYSQSRERLAYVRYLDYLRAAGYVDGPTEELELEDLQGLHGLKALRIRVAETAPERGFDLLSTDRFAEVA